MVNFRKLIFDFKDRISGGIVAKHLRDLSDIFAQPQSDRTQKRLEFRELELLRHAKENVPFYRDSLAEGQDIVLNSFPVINKNIIRDNLDQFLAEGQQVEKLTRAVTSGSTGTPFYIYQDSNKKKRNTADTVYFGRMAGYSIGEKLNYLKIWTKVNRKSNFKSWAENINPIDVTRLSDNEIKSLVAQISKDQSRKAFLGYASALESIVNYLEKHDPKVRFRNVTSVIAMSEAINEKSKALIHKYFGVYCVSRYSNVENGMIAQQRNDGSAVFHLNFASYAVEILDMETDNAVAFGTPGRIVITDYFNYAMPMIRYDTGDIGIMDWDDNRETKVLTKIEGRKMDMVFDTTGNLVSSFTITNNMWLYPEIQQYQFIQLTKNSYKFVLNTQEDFTREDELIAEFKKYFGADAHITVEYVNEIPLLNSGKRRKVINEYYV